MAECLIEGLPPELLTDILSRLSLRQQLRVRRVSQRWRATIDACLARRHELHLCRKSGRGNGRCDGVCPKGGIKLLESMRALRRLSIEESMRNPDPDQLSMDAASVEWLCSMCPHLQEVSLICDLDEACVKTLLRRLPGLRALSLPKFSSEGEYLSLLPAGLQSLALWADDYMDPASAHHLRRCPHLQELRLEHYVTRHNYTSRSPFFDEMPIVLAAGACPQLKRASFALTSPGLTSALACCTYLLELDISNEPLYELDLFRLLDTCGRLERLRVSCYNLNLSRPASGATGPRRQFGLTHLDINPDGDAVEDDTMCQLADLVPGLRNLVVTFGPYSARQDGMASDLRRFTSLQVLDLGTFQVRLAGPVLASLMNMPLTSLSCYVALEMGDTPFGVADLFQRCPMLTALRLQLPGLQRHSLSSLVNELASMPPMQREVTLFKPRGVAFDLERLPRNIRVVEGGYGIWERFTGWPLMGNCCDFGNTY